MNDMEGVITKGVTSSTYNSVKALMNPRDKQNVRFGNGYPIYTYNLSSYAKRLALRCGGTNGGRARRAVAYKWLSTYCEMSWRHGNKSRNGGGPTHGVQMETIMCADVYLDDDHCIFLL